MCVRRSFSELYQKSIQDAESKSGEGHSGEAWVLDERDEETDVGEEEGREGEREQGEGEESDSVEGGTQGMSGMLSPPSLPLLRASSLQENPPSLETSPSSLSRSYSLERTLPCQDICDGYTHTKCSYYSLLFNYGFSLMSQPD